MSVLKPILRTLLVSALLAAQVALSPSANAAPGDLDSTFGIGGKVTTDFGGFEVGNGIALQADSKLVTVGTSFIGGQSFFALSRYNPDGTLDSSFGSGGKVTTDFGSGLSRSEDVAIQLDGKIVAAGLVFTGEFTSNFAIARYNPDGSLDTSFGSGGEVRTDFNSGRSFANAVAVQPDGKILAAGATFVGGVGNEWALARYNGDGSLDASFGTGGLVITDIAPEIIDLALQPDGKIVAGGRGSGNFALARYNPDGSLDTSFGTGGKVATDWGRDDAIFSVALQPDGKIVAAGDSLSSTADFVLARYSLDGSLDSSFGTGGKVITDFGGVGGRANAVVLQPDGKIVAAGISVYAANPATFALARYNVDGSLDSSFGIGGKVTTSFGGAFGDVANALVLQPDGKIVAAGTDEATSWDFALARYEGTAVIRVAIDIKPGSTTNPIKLSSTGRIPIAILSSSSFDATTVDPASVCFGDAQAPAQRDCTVAHSSLEDVNADGRLDLLLLFETMQTRIDPGDTQACLSGRTFSGLGVEGCDSIKTL